MGMLAPVGHAVGLSACRRTFRGDQVHAWDHRTDPACAARAAGTRHVARLAGSQRNWRTSGPPTVPT
jgi:hypothetical protein